MISVEFMKIFRNFMCTFYVLSLDKEQRAKKEKSDMIL